VASSSVADAKRARFQADTPSTLGDIADLEWNFYSTQSGLTPASKYSITDHKMAYYKLNGALGGSIRDIETAFFKAQGAVGVSYDDIRLDFYANRQFFIPSILSNLELWLEADNISGAVLASDGFDRSKNLLALGDPAFERNTATIGSQNGATVTRDVTVSHSGTASVKVITPGVANSAEGAASLGTSTALPNGAAPNIGAAVVGSVYVKGNVGGEQVYAQIRWGNAGGGLIGSSDAAPIVLTTGWTRLSWTGVVPAGTAMASIKVIAQGVAAITYWVDDVQIEYGSLVTSMVWGDSNTLGSTNQGQSWTTSAGTWGTPSAGVGRFSSAVTNAVAFTPVGTPDQDVSLDIKVNVGFANLNGPAVRIADGNNYYSLQIVDNASINLVKTVAGVSTTIASYAGLNLIDGTIHTLRLVVSGNVLTSYVDGVQVGIAVDGALATGNNAGIKSPNGSSPSQSTFFNFSVKTPVYSDGAALPVWPDKSGYARHASQTTATKRPLWRNASPNLLSYDQATMEIVAFGNGIWTSGSATLAKTTAQALSGVASLQCTSNGVGFGIITPSGTSAIPINANQTYTAVISTRAATIARSFTVTIVWYDVTGAQISTNASGSVANVTTGWTQASVTAVSPVNAVYAAIRCDVAASIATEVHYVDNAGLFVGSSSVWLPPVSLPNSKPTVQFDAVDDVVSTPAFSKSTDATLFIVKKIDVPLNDQRSPYWRQNNGIWLSGSATALSGAARNFDGTFPGVNVVTTVTNWHVQGGIFTSGSGPSLDVDGTITTGSPNYVFDATDPTAQVIIGFGVGDPFGGNIAAVLIFSRALSTTERQQVERYLKNKYGTP